MSDEPTTSGSRGSSFDVRRVEARDHRGSLLQHAFGLLWIISRRFVGIDADRLGHVGLERSKVTVAMHLCSPFKDARDVDKDFLALLDAEVSDDLDLLFQINSLRTDQRSRPSS